ncbi:TIGR00730 family Rossman fold protein [Arcobacter sp. CECT 8985]|uniref:LOG family protein n=1 Tax=Arcobacter sp. CECT 8985 TaxID=1935424 RepID=UPI00100C29FD|nr:TIGR00730 family Rossman fold protein [Arcobacter sp. CECT 8985]RXJ88181.1 TIGR00730 family Rossman fold protein [Arcobacter sp. CECT 8985]
MNIAIYCGSRLGKNLKYQDEAVKLINTLDKYNFSIVYGGSISGLMGTISNQALKNHMNITGVITYDLINKELANTNLSKLYKVETIRERKALMEKLSNAFIAMPGGYGTFEEIFEVISNAQIGYHNKPCVFYNVNGYYDNLIKFLQNCTNEDFINKRFIDMLIISDNPNEICQKILNYTPVKSKWE